MMKKSDTVEKKLKSKNKGKIIQKLTRKYGYGQVVEV